MEIKYFNLKSNDGVHLLNCKKYLPSGEIKGIFQLIHGMKEYIERYDSFLSFLCENGYICVTHDHLGHGKSVADNSELGFIASENGYNLLVDDCHLVTKQIKSEHPNLPVFLLGHSMGSFVARLYAEKYSFELAGLIIMGTAGKNPVSKIGLFLTDFVKKKKGERYFSKFIDGICFGSYNKKFKQERSRSSWITSDIEIQKKYQKDPFCKFNFSISAMHDLIMLIDLCNQRKHFNNFDKLLPVLLVSGSNDPVGNYGKGVKEVYANYKKAGVRRVLLKIYPGARHEILNDFSKETVYLDILGFIAGLDKFTIKS